MKKFAIFFRKELVKKTDMKTGNTLIALSVAASIIALGCSSLFLIYSKDGDFKQSIMDILKYATNSTNFISDLMNANIDYEEI